LLSSRTGEGVNAEIAFDRTTVKVTVTQLQAVYYFNYVVAADFGISTASVQLTFEPETTTTGSTTTGTSGESATTVSPSSSSVSSTTDATSDGEKKTFAIAFVFLLCFMLL
jgi:hypothetical protein